MTASARASSTSSVTPTFRSLDDLPVHEQMFDDRWGPDMDGLSSDLFATGIHGLVRARGSIFAFRHRDLRALSAHPDMVNAPPEWHLPDPDARPEYTKHMISHLVVQPEPTHAAMRKVIVPPLMQARMASLRPHAERAIGRVLDEVVDKGPIDFQDDVANPAASYFWGPILGMTDDEMADVASRVKDFYPANDFEPTAEGIASSEGFLAAYHDIVDTALTRSIESAEPPEFLRPVIAAYEKQTCEKPELVKILAGVLHDGFGTIPVAWTNVLRELLVRPAVWERLENDPTLVAKAWQESIRLSQPEAITPRMADADIEYDGLFIPKGTVVKMVWFLGNRDPEAFPDPNSFDLDRREAAQTTFGGGTHLCPGRSAVAMFSMQGLSTILERKLRVRPAGSMDQFMPRSSEYHHHHLPVTIESA